MNNFEKQLEKWNNGVLRGAQAKLAKYLQVTTATVALWATGKRHPSKGYIAQMARLFFLDEYSVARLFSPVSELPKFTTPISNHWMLRDADAPSQYTFPVREKTVSLPVFSKLPATYPQFLSKEVSYWWTIPAMWAAKTRFLFHLPGKNDPDRLLFVEPCPVWKKGKIMLGKQNRSYTLIQVKYNGTQLVLYSEKGPCISPQQAIPIGIVTHYLGKLQFTP